MSGRAVVVLARAQDARSTWAEALLRAGFSADALDPGNLDPNTLTGESVVVLAADDDAATLSLIARLRSDGPEGLSLIAVGSGKGADFVGQALETGADDVLCSPFGSDELAARVHARFRVRHELDALSIAKRDAEVMLELTQALASSLDFHEILYTVVRRIADVVQVGRVSIVLAPEPDTEDIGYVLVASDDEKLTNLQLDLNKYPEIRQVLRTREALTIQDASTHPVLDRVREDIGHSELSGLSLFPIVWEQQAIGVLFLRSTAERGELSERETHLCQILANATAVALRNARVMQSLRDHTQQITFARFEAERRLTQLKRYADLFASAAEGIAVVGSAGRLLFANPRAYEILGTSENHTSGHRVIGMIHRKDRPRAFSLWQGFARGDYPRAVDVRIAHYDGDYIVCSCSFAPLADGDGAVLISFQDVTEQRRTEAEFVKTMEFLESLIDASVDGIIASDLQGNVILFNQGAERIYGYRADEVVGRMQSTELYPAEGAKEVMRKIRSEGYGGPGRLSPIQTEALGKDGTRIPIRLSAAMIYERGAPVATFGIFTDLREKLRVEERLAEAQQKLASTEKQALIAELAGTAAHELNQPLTSVMAYAELLTRKLSPDSSEYRAAQIMVRETERMAEIVRKIGKMTKYETKSYVGQQRILDLDKSSSQSEPPTVGD
ncbi:MAG: PAS domain S-box protein [Myxococcota bacterium]